MRRIGVLGASFNPPTKGHNDVVEQALPHFEELILVPSLAHAFGKKMCPIEDRLHMLQLFIQPWKHQSCVVDVMNVEASIMASNPDKSIVYTYDVLLALEFIFRAKGEPFTLSFIIGPDNADPKVWSTFYRHEDIEKQWSLFYVNENIPVRSTQVREIVRKTPDPVQLKQSLLPFVSESIADFIIQRKLYQGQDKE